VLKNGEVMNIHLNNYFKYLREGSRGLVEQESLVREAR